MTNTFPPSDDWHASDWRTRIAEARAALDSMTVAVELQNLTGARAALDRFFNAVEQMAEEVVDDDALRSTLAALLTGVANGLKGQPAPLHTHDWADLPVVAAGLAGQLHAIRVAAVPLHDWFVNLLVEYDGANDGMSMENKSVLMGKGETSVTAGDLRVLMAAISHIGKGMVKSDLPDPAAALRLEVSDLHRQLAHATLRADQGWQRYESANRDRNSVRAERAELAAHLTAIKEHTTGFACWFGMLEAQDELSGPPLADSSAIFHFMGSGASTIVTRGEIRRMLGTIYGLRGLDTSSPLLMTAAINDALGDDPRDWPTESSSENVENLIAQGHIDVLTELASERLSEDAARWRYIRQDRVEFYVAVRDQLGVVDTFTGDDLDAVVDTMRLEKP